MSEMRLILKSRCQHSYVPFGSFPESVSLLFPPSKGHMHSLASDLHPPSSKPATLLWQCFCHHVSLSDSPFLPLPFIFKDCGSYIGSTRIMQDNLPISNQLISKLNSTCNLNSPLSCEITYSIHKSWD